MTWSEAKMGKRAVDHLTILNVANDFTEVQFSIVQFNFKYLTLLLFDNYLIFR